MYSFLKRVSKYHLGPQFLLRATSLDGPSAYSSLSFCFHDYVQRKGEERENQCLE